MLSLIALLLMVAGPDLPADWGTIPYVQAQKEPKLRPIGVIDNYVDPGCKIVKQGGLSKVTVHLAFLVDDKGKIHKVKAKEEGCLALERKVEGDAKRAFAGVVQAAPEGDQVWYRTELDQVW